MQNSILLVSTYDLGRQPFGLASPAAWLREAGHEVDCLDLTRTRPEDASMRCAPGWSRSSCRCTRRRAWRSR